jgi:hypothetical protein
MIDPGGSQFSPEEIAEARSLISQTLQSRGIRMEESQLDVAMRRLLLHTRISGKPPIEVVREMVHTSAENSPPEAAPADGSR